MALGSAFSVSSGSGIAAMNCCCSWDNSRIFAIYREDVVLETKRKIKDALGDQYLNYERNCQETTECTPLPYFKRRTVG